MITATLLAGAVATPVTVPEVAVKWWQDYLTILSTIATLATAYTGLYFIFHGQVN